MAKKELQVSAIENGTVIDHIPADKLFDVINVLGITGMDNAMTFGANLKSSKLGKKAIIKIWDKFLEDDEVNKLALVAPSAKINIIRDYDVVEKKTVNVPEKVEGIVTRPRGKSEEEDEALRRELLADEKERAEHVMLVDLARNDMGRISEFGTVKVTDFMSVRNYSHVMHIVSMVEGRKKGSYHPFDLLASFLPAGTLSGAPKIRAMEIIEELEEVRRGLYGGATGYVDFSGDMDFCITIRTMIKKGREVYLQAGAGIVADSVPEKEYQECCNKVMALARTLLEEENL